MKGRFIFASVAAAAALVAVAAIQGTALQSFAQTLSGAKGLDVNYTVTTVGGNTAQYSLTFAKPNKARIDTPEMTAVADGTTVTRYLKKDHVYYKVDQTDDLLKSLLSGPDMKMWAPFFDEEAVKAYLNPHDMGTKTRKGVNYKVVQADANAKGTTKMTFYIDPSDYLAKQAEIVNDTNGTTSTSILTTTKAVLTTPADDMFAFKAPNGAKEIQEADLTAGHWMDSYDKALQAAAAGNKLVMIDFMASWCGPCHMMADEVFGTSEFKELTKDMVLVQVDVDEHQDIAAKYGITAMPTVCFVDKNGNVVHKFVGYGGPAQVLGEIKTAKANFRGGN